MRNVQQVIENTDWKLLQEQKLILFSLTQSQVGGETLPALEGLLNFLDAIEEAVINDDLVKEETMFPEETEG